MGKQRLGFLSDFVEAITRRKRGGEAETLKALARPASERARVACAVLVALAGSTSMPALATPAVSLTVDEALAGPAVDQPVSSTSPTDRVDRGVPQPGWTPTAPLVRPKAPDEVGLVSTQPHQTLTDRVVVRRGDTLWDIAARHLGPGASLADVAAEWPRWYAQNAGAIGPDPDLILPGLELTVPGGGSDR